MNRLNEWYPRSSLADFFETFYNNLYKSHNDRIRQLSKVFLYEIFIYTIAFLWKMQEYEKIGNLLNRTYFLNRQRRGNDCTFSFEEFIYPTDCMSLDEAICSRDGQQYA